jgi:hypothetical protein
MALLTSDRMLKVPGHFHQHMIPSGKLTYTLAIIGVGRRMFPLKIGDFQGPTVNLPEGNSSYTCFS